MRVVSPPNTVETGCRAGKISRWGPIRRIAFKQQLSGHQQLTDLDLGTPVSQPFHQHAVVAAPAQVKRNRLAALIACSRLTNDDAREAVM
jgi:hypothetical protein